MENVNFGKNTFCGPSVISAIAGINTDESEAVLKSVIGSNRPIKGVYTADLKKAFIKLDYEIEDIRLIGRSLFSCLFQLKQDGYYIFMVPGHFIAIEVNGNHKYICDNHTKSPINVSNSSRLGQKVDSCFKVVKK